MTKSVYEWKTDELDLESVRTNDVTLLYDNPLASFLYALKSSEAKRQYPARLSKFFDFIEIENNYSLDPKDKEALKIKLEKQSVLF